MLFSDAILKVRAATLHDVDTQFSDTQQLLPVLADEGRRLRRWLCSNFPQLCEAVVSGIVLSTGVSVILKSALANFESVVRVEKLSGAYYYPLDMSDDYNASSPSTLCWREQPLQLQLSPATSAAGTYQVVYLTGLPATIATTTTVDLPVGLEDVMCERASAWVRRRHNEEWQYHIKRADDMLAEARITLGNRYGAHGKPGLKRERWRYGGF